MAETFSSSTDSDFDGSWEEKSFLSEGFSDDSSSSSNITATAVTKVTMDPTKRVKLSAELSHVALSPWQRTESAPRQTDAMMFCLPNNEQLIGFRMIAKKSRGGGDSTAYQVWSGIGEIVMTL